MYTSLGTSQKESYRWQSYISISTLISVPEDPFNLIKWLYINNITSYTARLGLKCAIITTVCQRCIRDFEQTQIRVTLTKLLTLFDEN